MKIQSPPHLIFNLVFTAMFFFTCVNSDAQNDELWYTYPAQYWNSQALHLGNGYIGASFFGGVEEEKISITEESIWLGGPFQGDWKEYGINPEASKSLPEIRKAVSQGKVKLADSLTAKNYLGDNERFGSFSSIGDVKIKMINHGMPYSSYIRKLDLSNALGSVSYELDGTRFSREYFCSYPDKVMTMKFTADKPGKVGLVLSMDIIQNKYDVNITERSYVVEGYVDGGDHKFIVNVKAKCYGGRSVPKTRYMGVTDPYWGVEGADSVVLFLNISTDYKMQFPDYTGDNPKMKSEAIIASAEKKGYESIRQEHAEDYKSLFDRVHLSLESDPSVDQLPTNERFDRFKKGEPDIGLKELTFNLGRYLIISSSRPGTLPANLQGKWNTFYVAPWAGNYQANINIQEIYWSCGPTDLLECQVPYVDWTADLVQSGREVAKRVYQTDGWVSHTTGNIWGHAAPAGGIPWGVYPLASVWHCQHLWEQFAFSMDTTYLRETAYPIIKEAALFWTKNLTPYKNHFIVAPSISAEHGAFLNQRDSRSFSADSYGEIRYNIPGAIQDAQMIRDLFAMSIRSAEILQIDHDFNKKLKTLSKKLVPNLIGKYGQLQEWQADIDSPEDHHRHIAHLYAVCPGNEIHPLITPKLADAAKVSLNLRGDGRYLTNDSASGGNWSMCWRIWCWTRLMDGNRANKIFDQMLREQGFENLLTFQHAGYSMGRPDLYRETENLFLHFQLDASASTPGFMAEMLLQSHLDQIILLPALPDEWKDGSVTGLLARGGHKVDIQWKDGELVKAVITTAGKIPVIRVKDKIVTPSDDRIEIRKK